MLTSVLRKLVKIPIKENFNISFMRNEKSYRNNNCFVFFSLKLSLIRLLTNALRASVSMTLKTIVNKPY